LAALLALQVGALLLTRCAATELLPPPPHPDPYLARPPVAVAAVILVPAVPSRSTPRHR